MKLPLLSVLLRSGRLICSSGGYKREALLLNKSFAASFSTFAFILLFFTPFLAFAQFPYNESFKNPTAANVVFGGQPSAYLTAGTAPANASDPKKDLAGEGYLRLTNRSGNQKGYVYSNNVFLGTYGLDIEFEYFTYGGNGADGICFFLFDAIVTDADFKIGGFGGSLGYSQINNFTPGVSKGYLGIGIDEYGNFSDSGEDRQGGRGRIPNSVTLRGSGDGHALDGQNYKFLTTTQTFKNNTGFQIAGGLRGATPANAEYRKAIINLVPREGGGLVINLTIQHGSTKTRVITDYQYDKPVPLSGLKYGISSSTGGSNNYHEIRGLTLKVDPTKLAEPKAGDDPLTICQGNTTRFKILDNDTKPNAEGDFNPASVDLKPSTEEIDQNVTIPGEGTYTFSRTTRELTFTPLPDFTGRSTISYTYMDVYGAKSTPGLVTIDVVTPKITTQPQNVTICEGTEFVATATVEGAGATYQWFFKVPGGDWAPVTDGNGISGAQTTTLTALNVPFSANAYQYRLEITSASKACVVQSLVSTLQVIPAPLATVSGGREVCIGASPVRITFTGSNGRAPYTFNYTLDGTAKTISTSGNSNTVSVDQPATAVGTFTYALLSVSDQSALACSNPVTSNAVVKVNPLPTAKIAGSKTLCVNSAPAEITFSGENGTAPYTFSYKINGITQPLLKTIGTASSITIEQPTGTAGTFTYELLSVSDGSLSACSNNQTGNTVVQINPLPAAKLTGGKAVCVNSTPVVITFTGENGTAPYTFNYTVNGVAHTIQSTGTNSSITLDQPATTAGTFTYQLLSVSDASVTACSNIQTASTVVQVNPLPTARITGGTSVCLNSAAVGITFTGDHGTAPYTFRYKMNGVAQFIKSTGTNSSVSLDHPATAAGTFTYELLSVSDGSSTACSNDQTGSTVVQVNPLPTARVSGGTAVCVNNTPVVLTFTGENGTAPYTFNYTVNGVAQTTQSIGNSSSITIQQPATTAGTFTYQLVSVSDGSSTACSNNQSGSTVVQVNPLPTAKVTGGTAVCLNSSPVPVTFTGESGTAPYTFIYTLNGVAQPALKTNGTSSSITIDQPASTAGAFTYELVSVTDGSSTACPNSQSGSTIVQVNPLPAAKVTGGTAVCLNNPVVITFTGENGAAPYTFNYTVNGVAQPAITTDGTSNSVTIEQPATTSGIFTYALVSVSDGSSTACSNIQNGSTVVKVNPLPAAKISGGRAVCLNNPVVITFTGENGTAPYTFNYTVNGVAQPAITTDGTSSSSTIEQPATTAGTFTYALVSVSDASSTACSNNQTGSTVVQVNPLPTAKVSGGTAVCLNNPVVITFTGENGTAPYTFRYTLNGVARTIQSTGTNSTATIEQSATTAGTFTYELLSVSDASSTACTNSQTGSTVVQVNPLPTAKVTGGTAVCLNNPVGITFTGENGTAPYTFNYTINGIAQAALKTTGTSSSITIEQPATTAGTFTYTLVSVLDESSTACSNNQTGSTVVQVNPLPTATVSGGTAVCLNNPAVVTFTGENGTAPYTFNYTLNGVAQTIQSTGTSSSVTVEQPATTAGAFTYALVSVKDASSTTCSNNQTGSTVVQVNPLPTAKVSGGTAVCLNNPAVITFTGENGAAPYTFNYTINGVAQPALKTIGSSSSATIEQPATTAGTFSYELVSVSDASSTACSNHQTGSTVVQVNPLPTAKVSGGTAVCLNNPVAITFTGENGTAPYTFNYRINGVAQPALKTDGTNSSITIAHPATTAGAFTYELLSVSDAGTTACSNNQTGSTLVQVNPLPTAVVTGGAAVCAGSAPVVITFRGENGTAPYTFNYTINGVAQPVLKTLGTNGSITIGQPATTAGSFTYTLLSVSDASSTACSNTQTGSTVVQVNPLPTARVTGGTAACLNSPPVVITFTGENGTAPYTFNYTINGVAQAALKTNGTSSSATIAQPATTAGTFTYELLSVSDESSTACSNIQTGRTLVQINPLPVAKVSGGTAACLNSAPVVITFTGENGTAPYTFNYTVNGVAQPALKTNGTSSSITIDQSSAIAGTFVYELVSVSDAGSTACSNAQGGTATVVINPLPTAMISGNAEVCQGSANSTITFKGEGGTAPYQFTYQLNGAAAQTALSDASGVATISHSNAAAGNYVYTLLSVSDGTATACSNAQNGTATVKVNPLPTAVISGDTEVCAGSTNSIITIKGTSGTAPYIFTYQSGSGTPQTILSDANGLATISQSNAAAGTYVYTLLSVSDATTTACNNAQSGTATVKVNPLPTATISGNTEVCAGSPNSAITFKAQDGTAPYQFTYQLNGAAAQTISSDANGVATVNHSSTTAGTYVYTLLSVSDATITACSNPQSGAATVKVKPLPTAAISGNTEVCAGSTNSMITFQGQDGTAPYQFSYQLNGAAAQTLLSDANGLATVSQSNATAGTYVYTLLSVTDASTTSCSNAQSGTATVKVNPLPTAAISGNTEVCTGSPNSTITFKGQDGTAPYQFTYQLNGAAAQTISSDANGVATISHSNAAAGSFVYTLLSVSDATATACSNVQSGTATVKVNPLPAAAISGNTEVCAGSPNSTITFRGQDGTAPYQFTYQLNGAAAQTVLSDANGIATISQSGATAGTYVYTLLSVSDATATACSNAQSGTATVKVNPLPTAAISGNTEACIGSPSSTITFTGQDGTAPYQFTYQLNGGAAQTISSDINGVATISQSNAAAGSYIYTLISVSDASTTACSNAQSGAVTVKVNPGTTLQLTSAPATGVQTICLNCAISTINYQSANATVLTATGLPDGLTAVSSNGTLTITGSATVLGTFTYTVRATGICTTEQLTGTITVTEDPSIKLLKTALLSADKNTVTYTFKITNSGNVSLKNIRLTDVKIPSLNISPELTLAPGASTTVTAIYTISQAEKDAGKVSNTAAASGLSPGNVTVQDISGTAENNDIPTEITVPEAPAVTLVKTGVLNPDKNTISYTFKITNTGNVTLQNLTLRDLKMPGLRPAASLAPGASTTLTADYTITQAEKDAGKVTNTATASGVSPANTEVTDISGTDQANDAVTVIPLAEAPALSLLKTAALNDGNHTITYTFTITNTGNVTLKNLQLTDAKIPALNISPALTLAPGASTTVTAVYAISQAEKDAGRVSNTAAASGISPAGSTVNDISGTAQSNDTPTVINVPQSPSVTFTKIAEGTISSTLNGLISYALKVTNTGNVTLYNLTVTDPNALITGGSPIPSLAPNTSVTVTATHRITQADLDAGQVINQATVKGSDPNNGVISKDSDDPSNSTPNDPTVTPLNPAGAIALLKTGALAANSQAVIFTFSVTNTGNVTLKDIVLNDPMLGGNIALASTTLQPGQTISVNKTYTLTQQDKNAGKISNTATVKGTTPGNIAVTDVSGTALGNDAPTIIVVEPLPRVALVKTGVLSSDFATIRYTFQITNTGNVTLTDLSLIDTKFTSSIPLVKMSLEPGESVTTTVVYVVTDAEKRDGRVLNTATVTANSPSGSPVKDISGTQSNNDDPTLHIIEDAPQALNDNGETKINQPVTINLAQNDLPSFNGIDKGSIVISRFPANGQVQVNADGTIVYTPNRGYSGPDEFRYTINDLKGKVSNVALVNITVTPIELFIPNTFTPNGDGKNDTFRILGRESFDNISLLIFNRWGNEVYRNTNYLDEWDGSGLSEATYYYILVLKKGAGEVTKKGWILLKR
jgi:gliding motility-associated-like protein